MLPRYPVYVISKGRYDNGLTAKFLLKDQVPFKIVVEPQEADKYAEAFGAQNMLVLPFSNLGKGSIPARNWCWEHSKREGFSRHWILDDNIKQVRRFTGGRRIPCASGPAFAAVEDFTDRYENLAISGLNYTMFGYAGLPPFFLNVHVYSCLLIQNDLPQRWRGRYNEDTDLCLQVLSAGLCTALVNAFLIEKMQTMTMKGGNRDQLYKADGRLRMAKSLERVWPYVVKVDRRFKRPQHVVRDAWKRFDTPLKLKQGVDLSRIAPNEYGLKLQNTAAVKAEALRDFADDWNGRHAPVTERPPEKPTEVSEDE
jgi:hypothetical protein